MLNDYHGKSVKFDLPEESSIKESPLLTPKHEEEEEEEEEDDNLQPPHKRQKYQLYHIKQENDCSRDQRHSKYQQRKESLTHSTPPYHPSTPPEIDNKVEEQEHEFIYDRVQNNPDYIALTSSINMSTRTSQQINQELIELSNLNQYFATCSKENLIEFYMDLLNGKIKLPQPHRITKSPRINWSNYHPALSHITKDFDNQLKSEEAINDSFFKAFKLFDKV